MKSAPIRPKTLPILSCGTMRCIRVVIPVLMTPTARPYARTQAILASVSRGVVAVAAEIGCSARTVLRWRRALGKRLGELNSGVAGLIMRLDPLWRLPTGEGGYAAIFSLLGKARELLGLEGSLLAVGRLRPPWPSALPVFA